MLSRSVGSNPTVSAKRTDALWGVRFFAFNGIRTGAVLENVPVAHFPRDPACAAAQVESHTRPSSLERHNTGQLRRYHAFSSAERTNHILQCLYKDADRELHSLSASFFFSDNDTTFIAGSGRLM